MIDDSGTVAIEAAAPQERPAALAAESGAARKDPSLKALAAIFAGGNFLSMALRLAGGVLTARICDPSVLGLFSGMGLVLGYVVFLQLGGLNGLSRELPYFIGTGDRGRAESLAATAQAWSLAVGALVACGLAAFGSWQLVLGRFEIAAGWFTYAVTGFLLFYAQQYLQVTYRTGGDFSRLALFNVVQSALSLVLIWLVWLFSFYGLCLRALVLGLLNALLLWLWRPFRIRPHWQRADFTHLLKIGAPIFASGQLYGWWIILDATMVVTFFGTTGLGIYQLAVLAGQGMEVLPLALAQICYPRMATEYGRTGSLLAVLRIVRRPIAMLSLGIIPVVLAGWLAIPHVVRALLPKYVEGVSAAQWTLLCAAVLALAPVCDVFSVAKRLDLYAAAVVVGMATYVMSLYLLTRSGLTLGAFPQAMLLGRISYLAFCYFMVGRLVNKEAAAPGT